MTRFEQTALSVAGWAMLGAAETLHHWEFNVGAIVAFVLVFFDVVFPE